MPQCRSYLFVSFVTALAHKRFDIITLVTSESQACPQVNQLLALVLEKSLSVPDS